MIKNRAVRKKRGNPGRLFIVLIVALVFFGVISSGRSFLEIRQLARRKAKEERARDAAQENQKQLKQEVARLTGDSLYIEEIARREYGMIKPGEEVFNITLPDTVKEAGEHVAGK